MASITGTFNEIVCTFIVVFRRIIFIMRIFSEKSCRENQNPCYVQYLSAHPPPPEISAVYEITWKNTVEPQTSVWRVRIACRIPKTTKTRSEFIILIAFPLQQWLHERVSVLRYTYIAWLVFFNGDELSLFVKGERFVK